MSRFKLHIFSWVIVIVVLSTLECQAKNNVRTVVMFFAWDASLPAYQSILEGFHSSFSHESEISCNILTEYLDMNRFDNEDYARRIVDMYNLKFKDTPIDLIVVIGPGGYPLLNGFGLEALGTSPVIAIENDDLTGDTISLINS
jgi:hypothetical protein